MWHWTEKKGGTNTPNPIQLAKFWVGSGPNHDEVWKLQQIFYSLGLEEEKGKKSHLGYSECRPVETVILKGWRMPLIIPQVSDTSMCTDPSFHPWSNESRSQCASVLIAPLCSRIVALLSPSGPEQGSLYSAWILFSLQPAAALLGFLTLRLWLPTLLKACATLLRGLFESIPPWIIVQVKALCGGKQFENGLTCRFDSSFKHLSKLVHLEMLHMADRVLLWI